MEQNKELAILLTIESFIVTIKVEIQIGLIFTFSRPIMTWEFVQVIYYRPLLPQYNAEASMSYSVDHALV